MISNNARTAREYRLAAVSYLNAKPLVHGLHDQPGIHLTHDVPARLPAILRSGEVDAALIPVIDLVEPGCGWNIVSDACIGCDGESLTVKVFSHRPAQEVRRLHVDGESHTSVALAKLIWRETFGCELETVPLDSAQPESAGASACCEAILLIGDKVIRPPVATRGMEVQTDLGTAWKTLTGLPFVFAVWAGRADDTQGELAKVLSKARDAGVRDAAAIAASAGPGLGWPVDLARRYLTQLLCYTLTIEHAKGMSLFLQMAKGHKAVPNTREHVPACPTCDLPEAREENLHQLMFDVEDV